MNHGERRSPGLNGSVRQLGATLLAIARTRLAILRNDIEIEKATLLRIGLLAVLAVFFIGIGLVLLTLLVVIAFWDGHRVAVLTALTALYWVIGVAASARLYRTIRSRDMLLAHTLDELLKDHQAMMVGDE